MHGRRGQPARIQGQPITIPQSELLLHGDHASLRICDFIQPFDWSMIDIIPSGKR
jgi:hypothetical protein